MSLNAFNIVTEFRFDIAHAVADSKTLQGAVGQVSDTANQALYNIRRMGVGLVAQLGLFQGGFLGFLYSAVQSSEKFAQSQRNLANVLLTNKDNMKMGWMDFNSAMQMSSKLMDEIGKKGLEFGLDPSQMLAQTKTIAPMLLSHGLDDASLKNSIDISRGLLKSAPTLAIDPNLVQGQLVNLVSGRASLNDTLFQRLMSETNAFRGGGINSSQQFNRLDAHKRIEMVRQALLQFGSTAEVIEGNVNSLSGMMTRLTSLIKGEFSILKPLGEELMKPIRLVMEYAINWLNTNGRKVIENFTKILKVFTESPEETLAMLYQAQQLKRDVSRTGQLFMWSGILSGLAHVAAWFGVKIPTAGGLLTKALSGVWSALSALGTYIVSNFGAVVNFMWGAFRLVSRFFVEFTAVLSVFQGISRGIGMAKIEDAKWIADHMGRISEIAAKFADIGRKIMAPFELIVEGVAGIVSWFLTFGAISEWFLNSGINPLISGFDLLGDVVIHILSLIAGVTNTLIGQVLNLSQGNFGSLFDSKEWSNMADEGYNDFWNRYHTLKGKDGETKEGSITGNVTNIQSLTIQQNIKEQVEPDRIAFAAVDAFSKLAQNPTQGRGRAFKAGLVGR